MKLRFKDLIGTILIAAIAIPYVGYLINGEMPFIKDPRGMSATGLVLGVAAYLVVRRDDLFDRVGKAETALAVASLALGVVAARPGRDGSRRGAAGGLHGLDPPRVGRGTAGPRGSSAPDRTPVSVGGRSTTTAAVTGCADQYAPSLSPTRLPKARRRRNDGRANYHEPQHPRFPTSTRDGRGRIVGGTATVADCQDRGDALSLAGAAILLGFITAEALPGHVDHRPQGTVSRLRRRQLPSLAIPLAIRSLSHGRRRCHWSDDEPDVTCANASRGHQADGASLTSNP